MKVASRIDSQVVEDLIKKEVETNLKERKPSLVGNKLNEDDMKNFKKVAMSTYEKAYFSKNKEIVNIELVER